MRLVQEDPDVVYDPWRVIVVSILCQRTHGLDVLPVARKLFGRWPVWEAMAGADLMQVANVIRPLGMQHRRADALIRMSEGWGRLPTPTDAGEIDALPGVGSYVVDAYRLVVLGDLSVPPTDRILHRRWAEMMSELEG